MVQIHPRALTSLAALLLAFSVLHLSTSGKVVGSVGAGAVGIGIGGGIWHTHGHHGGGTTGSTGGSTTTETLPPPLATANLFVDANGGTCTRKSPATTYVDEDACGTWDAANDKAQNGDSVIVKEGSYGNQPFTGSNSRTQQALWTVAEGETVTVGRISNCRGNSSGCMSQTSITGPMTVTGDQGFDHCTNCTFDNIDFDFQWANGCRGSCGTTPNGTVQPFHAEGISTAFTVKNSKLHNAVNSNAMVYLDGSGPWTFDKVDIYNEYDTTSGAIHTEGIYANCVSNFTMKRSRIWAVPTESIFMTGCENATNWNLENNVFEHPLGPNANALAFRSGSAPSPSPNGFTMRNNTFGINAGVQWNSTDNGVTANGWFMYGNIFIDQRPPCSGSNITVAFTVSPSTCGSNSTVATRSAIVAGFVNAKDWGTSSGGGCNASTNPATGCTDASPGNYQLITTSPAKNVCQTLAAPGSASGYPALDLLGVTRPVGGTADCGAYEFQ